MWFYLGGNLQQSIASRLTISPLQCNKAMIANFSRNRLHSESGGASPLRATINTFWLSAIDFYSKRRTQDLIPKKTELWSVSAFPLQFHAYVLDEARPERERTASFSNPAKLGDTWERGSLLTRMCWIADLCFWSTVYTVKFVRGRTLTCSNRLWFLAWIEPVPGFLKLNELGIPKLYPWLLPLGNRVVGLFKFNFSLYALRVLVSRSLGGLKYC